MKVHQLFPLAVAHDRIQIEEHERQALIDHIIQGYQQSGGDASKSFSWTGDTNGQEFLFSHPLFDNLARQISEKLKQYLKRLEINVDLLDLYYQRSWATVSYQGQKIALHDHAQSNFSFAYFLKKPKDSGGTMFRCPEQPNELAKDMFNEDKYRLGLIGQVSAFNSKQAILDAEQDSILIFPSKALHSTMPNQSTEPRISLAGDVTMMLKEPQGFEHIMPNYRYWQKVD